MWSRKPTPVSRVPAPVPSSASVRRTSVSPVLRSIARRRGSWRLHSPATRASIDSACTSKPSARAIGAPARGELARRPSPIAHLGHRAAEVARRERRGEARGAARRQDVVGAGDVVAERGRARGADEQAAGRRARAARAPRRRRRSAAGARARTRWRARSPRAASATSHEREGRVADGRALDDQRARASPRARRRRSARRRDGRRRGCPRRARPGRACRAPPAELALAGVRAEHDEQVARARRSRRCRPSPRAGAWPPARRGCPGPTITSTRLDRLGAVGERGDRLRAAHAVDALDAAQPAGAEDRRVDLAVRARRRAHGDVDHAGRARGDDAHHDRARVRRAPAGHVHRRREATGTSRSATAGPAASVDARRRCADAGLGDARDVGDRHLQARRRARAAAA